LDSRIENIRVRGNELLFCADLKSICADLNLWGADLNFVCTDLNFVCADLRTVCADLKFLFFTNQTKDSRYTRYTATFSLHSSEKLSGCNHLR